MSIIYCSLKKFTSEEKGEICAICRKKLKKDDLIIQCSNCSTFFHNGHLHEWLKENSNCPVCKNTLIVLSEETDEEMSDDCLGIDNFSIIDQEKNTIKLLNPIFKKRVSFIFLQIIIVIIGLLLFAFYLNYLVPEIVYIIRYPNVVINWDEMLLTLPLLVYSFLIIFWGLVNNKLFLSKNWQTLEIKEDEIIISGEKIPKKIEISSEEIRAIYIESYEEEDVEEDTGIIEDLYCVRLEISCSKRKYYYLRRIFEDISSTKTEGVIQDLENFFMENHSIQISTFTPELMKKKYRKRILYIIVNSLFAMYCLMLISGFFS